MGTIEPEQDCDVSKKRLKKKTEKLENDEVFECNCCSFSCKKKSEWSRHINTEKHKRVIEGEIVMNKSNNCECGKSYIHLSSLYKHRKTCKKYNDSTDSTSNNLIMEIIKQNNDIQKQNKELQNKLLEITQTPNVTNIHNVQNVQNNFNLNMFLNEQCKDAISITDFIDSLQVEVSDLEATGKLGYVLGISRIFINKLKELGINERPLHCTDIKRETVYIKDKDVWEKDNQERSTLKQVVKKIARKNLQQLPVWQEQNPDFTKLDTPENNEFMKISLNSLGSYSKEEEEKEIDKIMKNVLKEVVVDKK